MDFNLFPTASLPERLKATLSNDCDKDFTTNLPSGHWLQGPCLFVKREAAGTLGKKVLN
jgi:hypothetical protein